MAITMVVAIKSAIWPNLEGKLEIFGKEEFHYLVIFLVIGIAGPGMLSLDHFIAKMLDKKTA
jgi:putative oxidoreductase